MYLPWNPAMAMHGREPVALFSWLQNFKILQDSPSHQIFQRMHEVLNVAKQNN